MSDMDQYIGNLEVRKEVDRLMGMASRPLVKPLPCPLCSSGQVQVCMDANNPIKDFAKCRICHCQAPFKIWNKPRG